MLPCTAAAAAISDDIGAGQRRAGRICWRDSSGRHSIVRIGDLDNFRTLRIAAERLQPEHADLIHLMHQDDAVMARLGGRRSRRQTEDYMEHNLSHWQAYKFGIWILRESETGNFIGRGGLRNATLDGCPEVEVAYGLLPEFWNRGLATEFTRHVVEIGSAGLGLPELVSITLPSNLASRRVLEKAGFQHQRDTLFKGETHVLYRWRGPATAL